MSKPVWGALELREGESAHRQIRRRRLWFQREPERWLYATDLSGSESVEAVASGARKPDDLPWMSIVGVGESAPTLQPALPDKPILLKAPNPVQILPRGELRLVVTVPVWVVLDASTRILDLDTDPVSRTWFGDTVAGEVAYVLEIEDWMVGRTGRMGGGHAHVPLLIQNDSQSLLSFQRLLVRVVHLSLYRTSAILCTNDVSVTFKSISQYSQLNFSDRSSLAAEEAVLVQEPRQRVSDSLIRRSFLFFRGLTE